MLSPLMLSWTTQKKPLVTLAPMADMTDQPFCRIVKSLSKRPFIFREMVSAEAIIRENEKTWKMTAVHKDEQPLIQQIFGADPERMAEAARIIYEHAKPEAIDINMGCPVQKMVKGFNGAALMKDPELASKIVKAVKAAVPCPVSVKTRLGWVDPTDCLEFVKVIEGAGADLLTVHGRTRKQAYAGAADWKMIAKCKQQVSIPLIANGDIFSAKLAREALEKTGADGVAVARGALGNPWIFKQIKEVLGENTISEITIEERIRIIKKHARLHIDHYGPKSLVTFRKHLSWYFKGVTGTKQFRKDLHQIKTLEELDFMLEEINAHITN
jgi:tRNA-dihydrouridine synthase B